MRQESGNSREESSEPPDRRRATHSEDGVDLTLIRWMLAMAPRDRLATLQGTVRSILKLRDARSTS